MKSNRRKFLRNLSLGTGALSIGIPSLAKIEPNEEGINAVPDHGKQSFNMSGYAAPKMDVVRIGIVGLGMRGPGAVQRLSKNFLRFDFILQWLKLQVPEINGM